MEAMDDLPDLSEEECQPPSLGSFPAKTIGLDDLDRSDKKPGEDLDPLEEDLHNNSELIKNESRINSELI